VRSAQAVRCSRAVTAAAAAIIATAMIIASAMIAATAAAERTTRAPATLTPAAAVSAATAGRAAGIAAVLAQRADALRSHDRGRFLATVDGAVPTFQQSQSRLYTALATVCFASWRYQLDAPDVGRRVPNPARFRGASEVYAPRSVLVRYQLAGFDTQPAATFAALTFLRRGDRWLLAADTDFDATGTPTQREVWDFGPLVTVTGRHSLVLGHPASRRLLSDMADHADDAVPAVSAVWGSGWPQRVVVVVPASLREFAAVVGRPTAALSGIAAMATAELDAGPGTAPAVGNRVVVNPSILGQLGALGEHVVLTHEVTHVAARSATSRTAPPWLVEGFADYVAYRGVRLPASTIAWQLADGLRARRLPARLPGRADFAASNPSPNLAYEEAWLAVRMIAEQLGRDGLVRFYRSVAGASAAGMAALADGLQAQLGLSPSAFTVRWQDYLRSELG